MCETCGCGGGEVKIEGEHHHEHEHEHVLADGTVVRHAHHDHGHHHDHDHHHHHDHEHAHEDVALEVKILEKNDRIAAENRGFLRGRGVVALNLMSSPGSGKTTLLEKTLATLLAEQRRVYVLEGDQETTRDADRIRATGARALQINTGKGCHLEAEMVRRGLDGLGLEPGGILFIENVGNLVCPALFDLGESARVVLFSVTEGEDKPLKYPHMFRAADLVIMTKIDLLPHLDFDLARAHAAVQEVKPGTPVMELSARSGQGMPAFAAWVLDRAASAKSR